MQSDSAPCHALCVPHKDAPGCYAVDGGVSFSHGITMKIKNLLITLVLCACGIANANESGNEPKLKEFALESMGIALNAPESWSDFSKEGLFQVIDEETNTQFTASVYDNAKKFTPRQWAELRFGIVNSKMTYLKYDNLASEVKADSWYGT